MAGRPEKNSARLRHALSTVYASETRSGSREFHASSAARAFCAAVSRVNGGCEWLGTFSRALPLVSRRPAAPRRFVEQRRDRQLLRLFVDDQLETTDVATVDDARSWGGFGLGRTNLGLAGWATPDWPAAYC